MKRVSFVLILAIIVFPSVSLARSPSSDVCRDIDPEACNHTLGFVAPIRTVRQFEAIPQRPVVLKRKSGQVHSGLMTDLSSSNLGKAWMLPLGASFGVANWLEIGLESKWLFKPFNSSTTIAEFAVYGRFPLIPNKLAGQVSLWVPTVLYPQFGIELLLPWHLEKKNVIDFFGEFKFDYFAGDLSDTLDVNLSMSVMFTIFRGFFFGVDSGINYQRLNIDNSISGENEFIVPVGLGCGYRLEQGTYVKLMFSFPDMAEEDIAGDFSGYRQRTLSLSFVQLFI